MRGAVIADYYSGIVISFRTWGGRSPGSCPCRGTRRSRSTRNRGELQSKSVGDGVGSRQCLPRSRKRLDHQKSTRPAVTAADPGLISPSWDLLAASAASLGGRAAAAAADGAHAQAEDAQAQNQRNQDPLHRSHSSGNVATRPNRTGTGRIAEHSGLA